MSLSATLNIGRSALATSQASLQTVGNNIANAGNVDYTRQVAHQTSAGDQQIKPGQFVGRGVTLDGISRQIDEALQGRLRASSSDSAAANQQQQWLGRVEAVFNELSDQDLSTGMSQFFNSWSELANKPQDQGLRQVVLQNGASLAEQFRSTRGRLGELYGDVDNRVVALAADADTLAGKIADLNKQILKAEGGVGNTGGGQANGLRDQRDAVLSQLSDLIDIHTVEQQNGIVNVYVGSEPLVFDTHSRGITTKLDSVDGEPVAKIIDKSDGGELKLESGQLGALKKVRQTIKETIGGVDTLASNMMFELNKLHSAGQGLAGTTDVTGTATVQDPTAVLNSDRSGLKQLPANGSFVVHVKDKATGLVNSTLVQVDLDGRGGNDTTLNSLIGELNGIGSITASNAGGRLQIKADNQAVEISFSQDSSGTLAALGVGAFFTGRSARDIDVSQVLGSNPSLLAAAKNGQPGDNQTARAIAALESTSLKSLNGATLKESYQGVVNTIATKSATASNNAEAAKAVSETLAAQREALSGVSLDEEAINLMKYQRAFQASARLVTVVDELMQTLLQMA